MVISILTLFPQIFQPFFNSSILKRAQEKNKVKIQLINFREFARDKHKTVDDKPYGGGIGMLLKVDVLYKAIQHTRINKKRGFNEKVILLDPTGTLFTQKRARLYSKFDHLILICGHYEGLDARIDYFIDEKISIGRFILTGGEIPAAIVTDAVIRLLPGVLENPEATIDESYSEGRIHEPPQYTRPNQFMGYKVPKILTSGNHQKISEWKKNYKLKK